MCRGKVAFPTESIDTAVKLLESIMAMDLVNNWPSLVDGDEPSANVIYFPSQSPLADKYNTCGSNGPATQILLHNLQQTEDVKYMQLSGSYDEAVHKVYVTTLEKEHVKVRPVRVYVLVVVTM